MDRLNEKNLMDWYSIKESKLRVSPDLFHFLWYVYNRGGVFIQKHLAMYLDITNQGANKHVRKLLDRRLIVQLFDCYTLSEMRNVPALYKVSNQFLQIIGEANSNVRRLTDFKKSIRKAAMTEYFLENHQWKTVNRLDRKKLLLKMGFEEKELPGFFLGRDKRYTVKSVYFELVSDEENNIFVMYQPEDDVTIEKSFYGVFFRKWKQVLNKHQPSPLGLMLFSENEKEKQFFSHFLERFRAFSFPKESRENELLNKLLAASQNQDYRPKTSAFSIHSNRNLVHVFWPNTRQRFFRDRLATRSDPRLGTTFGV